MRHQSSSSQQEMDAWEGDDSANAIGTGRQLGELRPFNSKICTTVLLS